MAGTVRLGREPSHQLPLPLASSIGESRIRAVKVTPAVLHCRVRPCVCRSTRGSCMLAGWAHILSLGELGSLLDRSLQTWARLFPALLLPPPPKKSCPFNSQGESWGAGRESRGEAVTIVS